MESLLFVNENAFNALTDILIISSLEKKRKIKLEFELIFVEYD